MKLPSLTPVVEVQQRLGQIFPHGTPNRTYCTRLIAARTVYVMLYIGAIDGNDRYLRPNQVTRMTDMQAAKTDPASRLAWASDSLSKGADIPGRWYAVDTREPIRDETLRDGLIPTGAVGQKQGLATTSAAARYFLNGSFAALFNPSLKGRALGKAIVEWQLKNLSAGAIARIRLRGKGAVSQAGGVLVTFPSGETRRLSDGTSSIITKAVVEDFSKRFLEEPGVIFLSESRNKVVARDESLAKMIGLAIPADRYLPDILLVDLAPTDPLLVFVEVVATDGAVTTTRKDAFLKLTRDAHFKDTQVAFVTAYWDQGDAAFRKTVSALAWNSFVWFVSEPACIIVLRGGMEGAVGLLVDLCGPR